MFFRKWCEKSFDSQDVGDHNLDSSSRSITEADMADEKKSPPVRLVETQEGAEAAKAKEPLSPRDLVITTFRDAYHAGQSIDGIGDAMKMGGVMLAALLTVMSLAVSSSDGMSAFISGIVVGAVAGAVLVIWCANGGARPVVSSQVPPPKQPTLRSTVTNNL
jgi:hypothetical protein